MQEEQETFDFTRTVIYPPLVPTSDTEQSIDIKRILLFHLPLLFLPLADGAVTNGGIFLFT